MGVIFCNDTVQFYLNLINDTISFYMEKNLKTQEKNNKANIIHDCQIPTNSSSLVCGHNWASRVVKII